LSASSLAWYATIVDTSKAYLVGQFLGLVRHHSWYVKGLPCRPVPWPGTRPWPPAEWSWSSWWTSDHGRWVGLQYTSITEVPVSGYNGRHWYLHFIYVLETNIRTISYLTNTFQVPNSLVTKKLYFICVSPSWK